MECVCLQVDKEERADVDRVYMTYVQVRGSNLLPQQKHAMDMQRLMTQHTGLATTLSRLWGMHASMETILLTLKTSNLICS